ncbi:MAG: preprotein translocase subunit SecE [Planctomycetota bacterium]|nr:MAG: preprotein translocase subunit SecE [Planctomycetota bacterium]
MSTVKTKETSGGSLVGDLLQAGLYKRSQGRIARQLTFAALAIAVAVGCWRLEVSLETWGWSREWARNMKLSVDVLASVVALAVFVPLTWICYRAVNIPRFADFLIAVEAEMNKVSWPSRTELIRASLVVLFVVFLLATVLFLYDLLWVKILVDWLGIQGSGVGNG